MLYTDGVTEARRERPLTPEDLGGGAARQRPRRRGRGGREVVHLAESARPVAPRDDLAVLVVALDRA